MTWGDIVLIVIVVVLIVLPPRWDPAIRWKERQERRAGRWK
jgi:hypothetical protein